MKRYVREIANDIIRMAFSDDEVNTINRVLRQYERGFITSFEAVTTIVNNHFDYGYSEEGFINEL